MKAQQDYYKDKASRFDDGSLFPRNNRNHLLKIKKIADLLDSGAINDVLEVGTGTGIHAEYILGNSPITYYGVDISRHMLDRAEERLVRFGDRVQLYVADAQRLPFKDASFDGVFCSGSLHHIPELYTAVGEMLRVLRPGRKIVIMEPNYYFPTNYLARWIMKVERNIKEITKKRFEDMGKYFELEGFVVENFIFTPPIPKSLNKIYDKLDLVLGKLPLLKRISVMLVLSGSKRKQGAAK